MHSVFRPKHQKLILQCYPSPKLSIAETKPNQAELSYLVFYASSRRTKLEKVGEFLLKKTTADIYRKRVGHLKVTLYILQELITKCSEDLGFMTPYVVSIIKDIISLEDLSTNQLASKVFVTYCETLQPIQRQVFTSNVTMLNNFLGIITKFLGFASNNSNKDWLRISLSVALVVADSIDPSFSQFEKYDLIGKSIYLILGTINLNQTDLSLIKVTSKISQPDQLNDNEDIDVVAIHALKSFFDTISKSQLDTATKNVISYLIQNGKDINWANKIVIICAKRTHIELRHRIMVIISNTIARYVKENKIDVLDYLLKILSNLLSSDDVQFVGLPVLNILNKLIEFQKMMILNNEAHILKDSYSDMIRSLSSRIYYNNQINDMITSIFSDYYNEYTNTHQLNEEQFFHFSQVIIDNVRDILNIAEKPSIKMKKSDYPFNLFNFLYLTLPLDNFPNFRQQIQVMWLSFLNEFYKENNDYFSKPNAELCITNNVDNNLCLFLESLEKILKNDPRDEIKAQMSITISTMVNAFQINLLINYLKFVSNWLEDPTNFKYSLSLLLLGISSSQIEDGHSLAKLIDCKIAYSQNENIWPEYIGYHASSEPSSSILTANELIDLLNTIPVTTKWMKRVNINQPIPAFNSQQPKQQNSILLMSASNSVLSLPINKNNSFNHLRGTSSKGINQPQTVPLPLSAHSTLDSSTNGDISDVTNNTTPIPTSNTHQRNISMGSNNSYNETFSDAADYSDISGMNETFLPPNNGEFSAGRSMHSGWSIRSGRNNRVNLKELMHAKPERINEVDLNRLVKTRTGGTLSHVNTNSTAREKSGLAFALRGIDLDDA